MTTSARHSHPIFPVSRTEFFLCSIGTALAIYAIGAVMGVQWFG